MPYILLQFTCGHSRSSYRDDSDEYFCPECKSIVEVNKVLSRTHIPKVGRPQNN